MPTPDPTITTNRPKTDGVWHRVARWFQSPTGLVWSAVILACVGSRLATAISYIEDPDSLRFALSVADEYDVAALQPHFPGYPVFWAAVEGATMLTGAFSAGFALVGGLATVGVFWALLRLCRTQLCSPLGLALAVLTVFNPLLWLMGTRYMPDLMGAAWALACLALLIGGLFPGPGTGGGTTERAVRTDDTLLLIGMVGSGGLAGLRLSALPLLLPPVLGALWWSPKRGRLFVAGTAGVLVWLVPMILDTGLATLIDVAWTQTVGHFTDFGGTIQTESDLGRRFSRFLRGLWADGLGAWWPGRHGLTAVVGGGVLGIGGVGLREGWRRGVFARRRVRWIGMSVGVYALWIFLFQNVVHKSRHVLPLLPLLLVPLAVGGVILWRRGWTGRSVVGTSLAAYAAVTLVLVGQHQTPTAIAQTKNYVATQSEKMPVQVVSVPLINDYLRAQQVDARYLSVEDSADVQRLRRSGAPTRKTLVVGTYASVLEQSPDSVRTFYHNPYVNRMWPEVNVYSYDP